MKSKSLSIMFANPRFAVMLIAAIALVIYSNTYKVPFVFDGGVQIENNEKIRELGNFLSLKSLINSPRSIVDFSFAINYRLGKVNPIGYHLVNILIHVTNGILAYFLALNVFGRLSFFQGDQGGSSASHKSPHNRKKKTGKSTPSIQYPKAADFSSSSIPFMSLWVGLLFVAHPIQTQAVTYMVQRYASMSALFYMVSVLLFIQARKLQQKAKPFRQNGAPENNSNPPAIAGTHSFFSPKILFYFAFSGLSGVLAFLSKENAATLPGIILMVEYFLFDRSWHGWKKKLIWIVPLGVLLVFLALYFLSVSRGFKFENLLEDVSVITRETQKVSAWRYLCTQFSVLVQYIRLLFFPVGQNIDHMYLFKAGFFDGLTPLALGVILAVIFLGIWNIRKRAAISFGIFWFFITLSIESSVFPISDAMFEHRLYLPVFGFAISTVYMIFQMFSRREKWANVLLASAVVIFGVGTYQRNIIWQNPFSLWADSARKNPHNYRAHNNLGAELNDLGQPMRAMREYSRALEIKPDFADANNNVGNILIRQGQFEEAVRYLSKALKNKPNAVGVHNNMGVALASMGDLDGGIRHMKKAISLKPRYAEAHNSLGNALAQKGLLKEAMKAWAGAAELDPRYAEPHFNMGVMFELQGDVKGARRCFSEAIRIKPNYAQAYSKLGFISAREGRHKAAMKLFSEALRINPQLPDARKGLQEMIRITGSKR